MSKRYTLKGINSDTETCELCGKTGLKRVMWLGELDDEDNETGNVMAMGTACGARSLGLKSNYSSPEQVAQVIASASRLESARETARELAVKFDDEIAIIRDGRGNYYTVRGKAFDANPRRYGMPTEWVRLQ